MVSDRHLCVAFGEPRPQSERQQELLCLQAAHSNCARYLRGVANPEAPATRSRIPRPTVLAAVVLLASIGFSFGFVLQRGGLELSGFQSLSQSAGASRPVPTTAAVTTASHAAFGPGVSISPLPAATEIATAGPTATPPPPTPGPTVAPTPGHSPSPTPGPSPSPSPVPTPSASAIATPVASPAVTPAPTPEPTPRRTATPRPTSDRFAVITRCPGRSDCWIYTVRTGDNLFSIAHWFGVSLDRIYAMNPWARTRGIHPGNDLLIPTPTR